MTTHAIRRQHEATSFPELRGATCSAFQAVRDQDGGLFGPLYIQLGDVWHRFYLDAGLLFWEEGLSPDPDDDLLEGEQYLDLAEALRVRRVPIQEINMSDCQIAMHFENGARLVLKHGVRSEGTELVEMVPGS